jgi:Tat protein secretion system quality control protein TatD with DNase activity
VSMFLTVLPNTSKWKIALGLHPKAVQYLTQDQFDLIRDQSSDRNEGENYRIHILVSVWCAKNLSEQKQGLISVPELLLETDSPYLSLSSDIQINNPRYLGNVTLIVAGLRGMQIAEVLAVSMANGWSLFS